MKIQRKLKLSDPEENPDRDVYSERNQSHRFGEDRSPNLLKLINHYLSTESSISGDVSAAEQIVMTAIQQAEQGD
jgi:hypothetical protein